MSIVAEG